MKPRVETDALSSFESETSVLPAATSRRDLLTEVRWKLQRIRLSRWALSVGVCVVAMVGILVAVGRAKQPPSAELTVTSQPNNAMIEIDGAERGHTPLSLTLAPGPHTVALTAGTARRSVQFALQAGVRSSQYFDLSTAIATPAADARLDVTSDPAGAEVRVDGVLSGRTPLSLKSAPGRHDVSITNGDVTARRSVDVTSGTTASVVVAVPRAAERTTAGWVGFTLPFTTEVREGGRLLGTSAADRLMLPTGTHTLELSNESLGFRTTARVVIADGKLATLKILIPNGTLALNALPWADVTIDGRPVGTTPLGATTLPIGMHEVVFRHPQYEERRETVLVTSNKPARLGIDFSHP